MVYSVRHNANVKLLQLFSRLGVALRIASKYDLQLVQQSCTDAEEDDDDQQHGNNRKNKAILWDDYSILAKPNSFYRSLILETTMTTTTPTPTAPSKPSGTIPLAVDGANEMNRIYIQLQAMSARRNQTLPRLRVVLKLDEIHAHDWKNTLVELHKGAMEQEHEVVGFALELLGEDKVRLEALSELIEFGKMREVFPCPQVHLANPSNAVEIDRDVTEWLESHWKLCNGITIDVSRLLVANAAALCARIIGVKQNDASRIHYYIDDGCYGSLSNYSKDGIPLPLKNRKGEPLNSTSSSTPTSGNEQQALLATVWGPTCDGLDKVCSDIVLPQLSRDDWLVFTDLGFCHEGTCFNGFSPPDSACCVLGGYL